ncbi:heavy-metal-associated domain-containing protein [Streptomyces sp. NPDC006385]|uniref:heavy-metal-associated domain-containing protein n=1 Tax=Streptomyces sp. NPDC006385 TaxID=3156761 RepID=UPI0033A84E48
MRLFNRRKNTEAGAQVLHIEGMHCTSCGLLIDDELEDIPGVRSSRTDVAPDTPPSAWRKAPTSTTRSSSRQCSRPATAPPAD